MKAILFESKCGGTYARLANGKVRYCANRKKWGGKSSWINALSSVPSTAKRLCVVNNFKER